MTIQDLTEEVVAPRRPLSGVWSPRKAKMQFPASSKSGEGDPLYRQYHFTPEGGGRRLGVYLRQDFERNPNPPVMVIAGGLGFGGPVAANGWRRYLKNWNPIIVDTRGTGISTPMADNQGWDTMGIVEDLIELQLFFGLREVGKIGYSFAGTLALLMAAELQRAGVKTPFVGALSPTFCQGDVEWCFDFERIASKMTGEQYERAQGIWDALVAPLKEGGIAVTPRNILDTYAKVFRCGNPNMFMDAFIRMRAWEYLPYGFLPDDYGVESVRRDMQRGLKPGKTLDDFLIALMKNEADLTEFLVDSEDKTVYQDLPECEIDARRAELRQATTLARNIQNEVGWTEGWRHNAGFDPNRGIAPHMAPLDALGRDVFVTLNRDDPLLPTGQAQQWRDALPESRIQMFDVAAHGTDSKAVRNALFEWVEEQRLRLCGPQTQDKRRAAVDNERAWQLDTRGAIDLSGADIGRAIALMLSTPRGDKDALFRQADSLNASCPDSLQQEVGMCPHFARLEMRRLFPMIRARLGLS